MTSPENGADPRATADDAAAAGPSRRRRLAFRLVALALFGTFGLVGAELIVRVGAPQQLSGRWRAAAPAGYFMNRPHAEARHRHGERHVTYRINALGLRGGPIETDRARVLVLGDSVAFGWLLAEEDTYVAHLQAQADARFGPGRVQLLNGGAGGWGTDDMLAYLEDFGERIDPAVVLVAVEDTDIDRAWRDGLYVLGDDGELVRGAPRQKTSGGMRALTRVPGYEWLLEHSHLVQLVRGVIVRRHHDRREREVLAAPGDGPGPAPPPTSEETATAEALRRERAADAQAYGRAVFARLAGWCRDRDVPLVVAATGSTGTTAEDHARTGWRFNDATRAWKRVAADSFAELGVVYRDVDADITERLGVPREQHVIVGDGHPDELAARAIGEALWPVLAPAVEDALAR